MDLEGKIDMILDGGAVDIGLESTILDMTVEPPMILRPGAITADMFEEVIGRSVLMRHWLTVKASRRRKLRE